MTHEMTPYYQCHAKLHVIAPGILLSIQSTAGKVINQQSLGSTRRHKLQRTMTQYKRRADDRSRYYETSSSTDSADSSDSNASDRVQSSSSEGDAKDPTVVASSSTKSVGPSRGPPTTNSGFSRTFPSPLKFSGRPILPSIDKVFHPYASDIRTLPLPTKPRVNPSSELPSRIDTAPISTDQSGGAKSAAFLQARPSPVSSHPESVPLIPQQSASPRSKVGSPTSSEEQSPVSSSWRAFLGHSDVDLSRARDPSGYAATPEFSETSKRETCSPVTQTRKGRRGTWDVDASNPRTYREQWPRYSTRGHPPYESHSKWFDPRHARRPESSTYPPTRASSPYGRFEGSSLTDISPGRASSSAKPFSPQTPTDPQSPAKRGYASESGYSGFSSKRLRTESSMGGSLRGLVSPRSLDIPSSQGQLNSPGWINDMRNNINCPVDSDHLRMSYAQGQSATPVSAPPGFSFPFSPMASPPTPINPSSLSLQSPESDRLMQKRAKRAAYMREYRRRQKVASIPSQYVSGSLSAGEASTRTPPSFQVKHADPSSPQDPRMGHYDERRTFYEPGPSLSHDPLGAPSSAPSESPERTMEEARHDPSSANFQMAAKRARRAAYMREYRRRRREESMTSPPHSVSRTASPPLTLPPLHVPSGVRGPITAPVTGSQGPNFRPVPQSAPFLIRPVDVHQPPVYPSNMPSRRTPPAQPRPPPYRPPPRSP